MATFYVEITEVVQWQLWSKVEGTVDITSLFLVG